MASFHNSLINRNAFLSELEYARNKHHAIENRDAEEYDKSHGGRDGKIEPRNIERKDAADEGEGQVENDQHCQPHRSERHEQEQQYQAYRDRADDHQPAHRALLIFKLSSPCGEITRRQTNSIPEGFFGFRDIRADISVVNVDLDADAAQSILPAHLHRTLRDLDIRQLA